MNPFKWLLTKSEPATKESIVTEQVQTAEVATASPVASTTESVTPAVEVQTGVKDLKAAVAFIEAGIEHLGEGAKDELIALAQKYL